MSSKQIQLEIFQADSRIRREKDIEKSFLEKAIESKLSIFPTRLCIKAACLIIVVILSFALGVERGKIISKKEISNRYLANSNDNKIQEIKKEITTKKEKIQQPLDLKKIQPKQKTPKENNEIKVNIPGYSIQVATYKRDSSYIEKEITKLKQKGYATFVIPSGNYTQVCAGKFINKKDAQENLVKLRRTYKDCFIIKI